MLTRDIFIIDKIIIDYYLVYYNKDSNSSNYSKFSKSSDILFQKVILDYI